MIRELKPGAYRLGDARLLILPAWLIALYAIGLVMREAATVCLWIVCAVFLFVLLEPLSQRLKKWRWPSTLRAMLLVLVATATIGAIVFVFGRLFADMVQELQQSKSLFLHVFDSLTNTWNAWNAKLAGFHPSGAEGAATEQITKVEVVQPMPLGGAVGGRILHGLGSAATILTFSLLTPILTFFLLAEGDGLGRTFSRAYRDERQAALAWRNIVKAARAYFVGNLILGLITYPVFILIFRLFDVPSTFTVAALASLFNLIPFAGSLLSGFLPAVALFAQTQTPGPVLALYGICIAIHFAIADFVTPKVLGSQVNINATTSTIALVVWGEFWGGLGLLLAIPLTSMVKILFEHSDYEWLQWLAGLMSAGVDATLKAPATAKSKSSQ